jgi:hypothetical protein
MDAEIRAVDTDKRASGGQTLAVKPAPLELALRPFQGLPFGEHKDRHYVEVQTNSCDGATHSTLIARLTAADLQRLFEFAVAQGMVTPPVDPHIVQLVQQLREAVAIGRSVRQ